MIYLLPLVHLTLQSERKQEILPWGQNQLSRQVIAGCESTLSQKLSVSTYAWNSTIEMIDDCLGWMAKKKKMFILQLRCVRISCSTNTVEAVKLIQAQCFRWTPQLCCSEVDGCKCSCGSSASVRDAVEDTCSYVLTATPTRAGPAAAFKRCPLNGCPPRK